MERHCHSGCRQGTRGDGRCSERRFQSTTHYCSLCSLSSTQRLLHGTTPHTPTQQPAGMHAGAMNNPALFADVDRYFYGDVNPCETRRQILDLCTLPFSNACIPHGVVMRIPAKRWASRHLLSCQTDIVPSAVVVMPHPASLQQQQVRLDLATPRLLWACCNEVLSPFATCVCCECRRALPISTGL